MFKIKAVHLYRMAFPLSCLGAIYLVMGPLNPQHSAQKVLAPIHNDRVLKAEPPQGNFGPQSLVIETVGQDINIPPVAVDSMGECFDRAKDEIRERVEAGAERTIFKPRCYDVATGAVVKIER